MKSTSISHPTPPPFYSPPLPLFHIFFHRDVGSQKKRKKKKGGGRWSRQQKKKQQKRTRRKKGQTTGKKYKKITRKKVGPRCSLISYLRRRGGRPLPRHIDFFFPTGRTTSFAYDLWSCFPHICGAFFFKLLLFLLLPRTWRVELIVSFFLSFFLFSLFFPFFFKATSLCRCLPSSWLSFWTKLVRSFYCVSSFFFHSILPTGQRWLWVNIIVIPVLLFPRNPPPPEQFECNRAEEEASFFFIAIYIKSVKSIKDGSHIKASPSGIKLC